MMCVKWLAIIAGALGLMVLFLPLSLQAQLVLSLAVLAVMFGAMTRPDNKAFRLITFSLSAVLALRYGYWRTTQTLPSITEPMNFIPGLVLYAAELYSLIMLGVSFFMLADPLRRKLPEVENVDQLPTVDIFIPTYNEDPEMLAVTLAAAKSMIYPREKLQIYLLDDGGTEQKRNQKDPKGALAALRRHELLKGLCESMGVNYSTRARNEHAKAGNLNEGLKVSRGELVVVFDADHAPVREFLRETVPYFLSNDRLFLVQTPHFFMNPDPLEKNLDTFARMPSENEMFYSEIQRGLDKWNASFFCGSAAVLSRKALETTGGFAGQSITEDCETALALHCKGWESLYVDKPLIAGLQPETFVSFIGQRARWCQGMLQILILNRPFLQPGLSMPQRISYAGINLFWLFPISRLTFVFAPLLYIFFSLEIFTSNILEFFAFTMTYLAGSFAMQSWLHGRVRWPWISELYEYVQAVMLLSSIFSVIRNPRKPTFNVTAKGQTLEQSAFSGLARPYIVIFGVLLAAALYSLWRLATEPLASDLLMIVAFWNFTNLGLAGAALGVVVERRERRRNQRLPVRRRAQMRRFGVLHSVLILDASSGGISVELDAPQAAFAPGEQVTIELRRNGHIIPFDVVFRSSRAGDSQTQFGFAYAERTPEVFMAIADLMYSDQSVLQERIIRRQVRPGFFAGTLRFAFFSVEGILRTVRMGLKLVREEVSESHEDAPILIRSRLRVLPQEAFEVANQPVTAPVEASVAASSSAVQTPQAAPLRSGHILAELAKAELRAAQESDDDDYLSTNHPGVAIYG